MKVILKVLYIKKELYKQQKIPQNFEEISDTYSIRTNIFRMLFKGFN